jgi:hypothetical protein
VSLRRERKYRVIRQIGPKPSSARSERPSTYRDATTAAGVREHEVISQDLGQAGRSLEVGEQGLCDVWKKRSSVVDGWPMVQRALKRYGDVNDIAPMVAFTARSEDGLHHRRESHSLRRHQWVRRRERSLEFRTCSETIITTKVFAAQEND